MRGVLILGASSAVGRALAIAFARQGDRIFLAARNTTELERIQRDLQIRFQAEVQVGVIDAEDTGAHEAFITRVLSDIDGLDVVIFAIGQLGDQPQSSHHPAEALRLIDVNFRAAVSLLAPLANYLEEQRSGAIIGITSVAGDRGRQSNYVYGAAKGGFSLYLQGLRNRLEGMGVKVYTVKPGFIDTSMTYGLSGLFLVASPDRIATSISELPGKASGVYYLPWFWRWIMLIIKLIPEFIFKKMKL